MIRLLGPKTQENNRHDIVLLSFGLKILQMISRRQMMVATSAAAICGCCRSAVPKRASLRDYLPANQHDAPSGEFTSEIQRAINETARDGAELIIPAGTYWLVPMQSLMHADPSFACHAALRLRSSLRLRAEPGAHFVMAAGLSSDTAPRAMVMFGADDPLSDISISGLTMDMNGATNPISPRRRERIFSRLPQAHIFVSGGTGQEAARIDNCHIARCLFTGSPGVSCIVSGQSNAADAVIGRGWLITSNRFSSNGFDTDDHSSIFGQTNTMVIRNNRFDNPAVYNGTGGNTAHEVHGADHLFERNKVHNYLRGVWVSSSYAAPTTGTKILNNEFRTMFYGVDFFRDSNRLEKITGTTIMGNDFFFDDSDYPDLDLKAAVQVASPYAQSMINISANSVTKTGAGLASAFLVIAQGQNGPGVHDLIDAIDNQGSGLTFGIFLRTSPTSGLGRLRFLDNRWTGLRPAGAFAIAAGCIAEHTGAIQPIASLTIGGGDSIGESEPVPALLVNTQIRSLTLKPVTVGAPQHAMIRGGAGGIETISGSLTR